MTTSRASRCGREAAVDDGQICQALPDDRERRKRRLLALVEGIVGVGAEALQPVGVRQHLARRRELVVLAGDRRDLLDLRQLEGQELRARGVLARAGEQPFALGVERPARSRTPPRQTPVLALTLGERVEEVDVGGRVEQDLVLVLAVQVDEDARQLAERGAGREGTVDEGAAAALRGDLPPQDDFLAVRPVEDGLDGRRVFTRSGRGRLRRARRRAGPTAPTRMDFPAPVSPVRTLRPGSNSSSRRSMTARLRMERKRSMNGQVPSYQIFDSENRAMLRFVEPALSQRRANL